MLWPAYSGINFESNSFSDLDLGFRLCVDDADNFTPISRRSESMCSNAMEMCSTTTSGEIIMTQALSHDHPAPHKAKLDRLGCNHVSLGCMHNPFNIDRICLQLHVRLTYSYGKCILNTNGPLQACLSFKPIQANFDHSLYLDGKQS